MLNLIHLQSFLAIAQEQSIIKASKKLYVNPSSLQQQMNLFEAELGFPVLERSRKGCTLTAAGQVIASRGTQLLDDIEAMLAQAGAVAAGEDQTISIALSAPFNALPLLNAFKERFPNAQFKHLPSAFASRDEMMQALLDGKVDVAEYGFVSQEDGADVRFQEFSHARMCLACSLSHPLAANEEVQLDSLEGQTLYACRNGSDINRIIANYLDEHGLEVDFRKIVYSPDQVVSVCEQGGMFLLADDQTSMFPHLRILPFTPAFSYRHSFAYLKDCRPIVSRFIDFVRESA